MRAPTSADSKEEGPSLSRRGSCYVWMIREPCYSLSKDNRVTEFFREIYELLVTSRGLLRNTKKVYQEESSSLYVED